ncbi:hypothetical protein CONCODRAFT_12201 [Conidiobolus coronatus NRRL 28638]|uniref:Secreted protein n=1 Tax=Conidiobolus coronatus (strain ATCC 28846 / CBS 209.66 / NRRL 28638) TaxID=796925 RepID=A0A137NTI9_CONC2|nr:hypothetical protein CONCODRAFT_12201 [Conidiobolus coronatus NRRL 28638]|eukprot:KXN66036.1 hypothetical protein CONCODRAFT_12201 [Conidiobolus coronatus NRRL 28638]
MFIKSVLILVPFIQFALGDKCGPYVETPKYVIKPFYENTTSTCDNVVNGKPAILPDPHNFKDPMRCEFKNADGDTRYYKCNSNDSVNDFVSRAKAAGWNCN